MTDPQEYNGAFPTFRCMIEPSRRAIRWLWRIGWRVSLVLLGLLIIAHLILNIIAGKRLEAEFKRLRAAGDPLTAAEIIPPEVPDSENAAVLYQQAFDTLPSAEEQGGSRPEHDEGEIIRLFLSRRLRRGESRPTVAEVESLLAKYEKAFDLLEEGSRRPSSRFPFDWEVWPATLFSQFAEARKAARFLIARALVEAKRGHSKEALDDLTVALRLSNHVSEEPVLIAQLVRCALIAQIFQHFSEVLATAPPSPEESRAFYDLLGKIDVKGPFLRAMKTERVCGLFGFDQMRRKSRVSLFNPPDEGQFGELQKVSLTERIWSILHPALEPILRQDEVIYLQSMEQQIASLDKPYAESRKDYDEFGELRQGIPFYAIFSRIITPVFSGAREKRDEIIAEIYLMQAALALRAYQIEHGEYPASLEQLSASGGWEIQQDPFTDRPFIYRREGKGYIIFSLGPNAKDDGGIDRAALREKVMRKTDENMEAYDITLQMPQ